jgi:hypothetical protein
MKTYLSFLTILSLLFLASCQKDTDIFIPDPGQQLDSAWVTAVSANSQVTQLTEKISGTFNADQVSTATDTSLRNNTGFIIEIPRSSLLASGAEYTGIVRADFVLVQKKGDFIRYGIPTSSNRYPLESGGAFFIKLETTGGVAVSVNPNKRIYIKYPDEAPKTNMSLYSSSLSPSVYNSFNWQLTNDGSQVGTWTTTSTPAQKGYVVSTSKTGWLNVDRPLEPTAPKTDVNVVLPNLFSNANTVVYLVFKSYRSVVQLTGNSSLRNFSFSNIPVNSEVKIVTISKVADSYYLGTKDEKIITNFSTFVKPELSSLVKIQQLLSTL